MWAMAHSPVVLLRWPAHTAASAAHSAGTDLNGAITSAAKAVPLKLSCGAAREAIINAHSAGNAHRAGSAGSFTRAVLTIITAIFLFDVQGAIIKHLAGTYPVSQIAVFRNLFGMLPSLLVLLMSVEWRAQGRPVKLQRWQLALGRGGMLVIAQMCFYFSLSRMELATATTLAFAGPLFVTTLSIPLLGHRVGWWRGIAVLVGFIGVLLVMQPGGEIFTLAALLPVTAAFFYALSSLTARFFDQSVATAHINLYASVGTLIGSLIIVLLLADWQPVQNWRHWCWLLAMGTAGGIAVLLMISAYRMTRPGNLAPFEYMGIPFSFVLGWWFFSESPFDRLFPGTLLIVCAGLIVVWRERVVGTDD